MYASNGQINDLQDKTQAKTQGVVAMTGYPILACEKVSFGQEFYVFFSIFTHKHSEIKNL